MNIILEEIAKKNNKVFINFFDKHYMELVNYANGYLFSQDSSEDIVQEVFIYIWENAENLNITTSLRGYLFAMVRNKCFNYLRSIKITDSYEYLDLNNEMIAAYVSDETEEQDKEIAYTQVIKAVDTLPDKMQRIVKLKFFHNYKYSEIAMELGVSINTVKTQLKRAKRRIIELAVLLLILLKIYN